MITRHCSLSNKYHLYLHQSFWLIEQTWSRFSAVGRDSCGPHGPGLATRGIACWWQSGFLSSRDSRGPNWMPNPKKWCSIVFLELRLGLTFVCSNDPKEKKPPRLQKSLSFLKNQPGHKIHQTNVEEHGDGSSQMLHMLRNWAWRRSGTNCSNHGVRVCLNRASFLPKKCRILS